MNMTDGDMLKRRDTRPKLMRRIVITCLLVVGTAWLANSFYVAVFAGPSDVLRRWRVSQYLLHRSNPYQVALNVLRREVGRIEEVKLGRTRIFHIPPVTGSPSEVGVLPQLGEPEAVYPPTAQLLITGTIGWLPEKVVLPLWAVINIVSICYAAFLLAPLLKPVWGNRTPPVLPILALLLLWPPTQQAVISSQFSIQILVFLLLFQRNLSNRPVLAGVWLSLAFVKPSIAIPFLILPLVRGRWSTLAVVIGFHVLAVAAVSAWVAESTVALTSQWVEVTRYFTQGPYSIQTVLNKFALDNTLVGTILILAFLGGTLAWSWWNRTAGNDLLFDFLCVVSVLWTYHGPYDLIILLIPVLRSPLRTLNHRATIDRPWVRFVAVAPALLIIALGTWSPTYVGPDLVCVVVRWACRFVLIGGLVVTALQLRRRPGPLFCHGSDQGSLGVRNVGSIAHEIASP